MPARVPALALGLLLAASAHFAAAAQDEASRRGQEYHDQVAAACAFSAPFQRLLGVYCGRKWIGHSRYEVRRVESRPGYELSGEFSLTWPKYRFRAPYRYGLDAGLHVLTSTLHGIVLGGRAFDRAAKDARRWPGKWPEAPGTTLYPLLGFLLAAPAADALRLYDFQERDCVDLRRLPEGRALRFATDHAARACFEMRMDGREPHFVFFDEQGQFLGMEDTRHGMSWLPVDPERVGKDLDVPLDFEPPVCAVVDLILAAHRGDEVAVLAGFDLPGFVRETHPDFAIQDLATPEAAEREARRTIVDEWMPAIGAALIGDEEIIANLFGHRMRCRIDADRAEVVVPGVTKFLLGRDGAGAWRVVAFEFP